MRNKRDFAVQVVTDAMEAVRRVVYGRGALQACAESLGISHQTLSKQLNEEEGTQLSVRKLLAIEAFMDTDAVAECFSARRGGVFVKLPDPGLGDAELLRQHARMAAAYAEASRAFSIAIADGKITAAEVDIFAKDLRELYAAGESLVQAARVRVEG